MPAPQNSPTAQPSGVQRRRSTRLAISIPIILKGKDASGNSFEEKTQTLVVSKHGAMIATTRRLLQGAEVTIENPSLQRSSRARIVLVENDPAPGKPSQVAAAFLVPQNLWGIEFPPPDWNEGAATRTDGQRAEKVPVRKAVQRTSIPVAPPAGSKAGQPDALLAEPLPQPTAPPSPPSPSQEALGVLASSQVEARLKAFEASLTEVAERIRAQTESSLRGLQEGAFEEFRGKIKEMCEESVKQISKELRERQEETVSQAEEMFRDAIAEIFETIGRQVARKTVDRESPETLQRKKPL